MTTTLKNKFADLFAKTKLKVIKPGDIVEGEVFAKSRNKLWIDIKGRALGVIYGRELSTNTSELSKGDKVIATVIEPEDEEGQVILSLRRADREKFWDELKNKYENGDTVSVKVVDANKGGLMVEISDIRGFLPVSQLTSSHYPRVEGGDKRKILEKLNKLLNSKLEVKIITFDKNRNDIIFSEKAAGDKAREEAMSGLKVGDKVKGIISGIIDFGLFIRFNNIEGLVHISEISWEKISDLRSMFKVGDEVEAEIISVVGNKVSLSIKRLLPDKWVEVAEKYKLDQVVEGEVTKIVPFGAFVKLDEKIDALAHISDHKDKITEKKPLDKVFVIGKKYHFKITKIDKKEHRIALKLVKTGK